MAGNTIAPGVSVTARALSLLGAFDETHRVLTLSQLARRSGLPLPTAHRLLTEFVSWGALNRMASGEYVIGRRLWDIGLLAPEQTGLRHRASPFLQDLFAATHATTHLAVRDGDQVLYLERVAGRASVPIVSDVGTRLPMYATGVGKVLLAYAPPEIQTSILLNLTRITPYTITQPARLREQLRRVLREGFAQTSEEMSLGACSLAVPIHASDGTVVASLGVVVAELRRDRQRLLAGLRVAAQGIERSIAPLTVIE